MSLNEFKDVLISSKKYWLIYLVLIIVLGLSTVSYRCLLDPTYEIYTLLLVAVLGILCIVYYFMHDSDQELYKVAFVIILCFGIFTSFIVPICDVSDETEHLARAEITSRGVLIPHWTGEDLGYERAYNVSVGHRPVVYNKGSGFASIEAMNDITASLGKTVFTTPYDKIKIDYTPTILISAFEQNPFYGYLPQAAGMDVAKLLDLNVIWMLWLGRIFNLIFYAGVIALAIKKTPVLKMPLLAVACIPISIYQASSLSIDSMIIGLAILAIALFLRMYKADRNSLGVKHVVLFSLLCLILGLCKLPYLAFIFFLLLIPFENFEKGKKIIPYMLVCIAIVGIIGVMWSRYSEPTLMHSWRARRRYLDPAEQRNYIMANPGFLGNFFGQIFTYNIAKILYGTFNFFGGAQRTHYADSYHLIVATLLLFLAVMLLAYPKRVKFNKRTRIGTLFIVLVIYVGTCFIQLLTWASVGNLNLGLSARYFVALFALFPIIGTFKIGWLERFKDNIDKYAMIFIISFMAVMILSFATKYY